MSDEHDGERQFEAEATAEADRLEAEAARIRQNAVDALEKKSAPHHVIDGESGETISDPTELAVREPWPHGTLEYLGTTWEYRIPKPLAAMFLGAASRKKAKAGRKIDAIMGYLEHVLSDDSLAVMMERAQDHDDEFDVDHMAELIQRISAEGSARPTGSIRR